MFTTNHKEKLEKLDLGINSDHQLFEVIEALLKNKKVTPAEIAEELLKSEDPNVTLRGVVEFLEQK